MNTTLLTRCALLPLVALSLVGCPKRHPIPMPYQSRHDKFTEPLGDPRLGPLLETQFEAFLAGCTVLDAMHLSGKTAVAAKLANERLVDPTARVIAFPETSGRRLFRFVSTSSDLTEYPARVLQAGITEFLDEEAFPDALPVLRPDKDAANVGFTYSCSSYFGADLSAKIQPPGAAVNTALQTEQNRLVRVVYVQGFFQSPFDYLIEQGGAGQLLARLTALKLYARNAGLASDSKYISGFRGVLVFRADEAQDSTRFNFSANAGAAVPLASVDFKMKAGFDFSSAFKAQDFASGIFLEPPGPPATARPSAAAISNAYLARMPDARDILAFAKKVTPFEDQDTSRTPVAENVPFEHWNEYVGVPASICTAKDWKLEKTGGTLDIDDTKVTPEPRTQDGYPSCRFTVSARGRGAAFAGRNLASLEYELRKPVGNYTLALAATRTFNVTGGPFALGPTEAVAPSFRLSGDQPSPTTWAVDLQFQEKGSAIDWSRSSSMQFRVTRVGSPTRGRVFDGESIVAKCDGSTGTCTVTLRPVPEILVRKQDISTLIYETVQVTGTITIPVGQKGSVVRPVTFQALWPLVGATPNLFLPN